jgi:hypothetical protein
VHELFVKHNFTHVFHMAAQAGVRYSLEHPLVRACVLMRRSDVVFALPFRSSNPLCASAVM